MLSDQGGFGSGGGETTLGQFVPVVAGVGRSESSSFSAESAASVLAGFYKILDLWEKAQCYG